MIPTKARQLFCAACLLLLHSIFAFGQSQTTGRIAGTVKDPNGATVAGAEVTIKSLATYEERKVTTDAQGSYGVPLLPPGAYRVNVRANGFKRAEIESVRIVITETTTVDATLEVGNVNEQVVVSAPDPLIQTS